MTAIAQRFDRAAAAYDRAASVQAQAAEYLVDWAVTAAPDPKNILDLGCGTGFAAQAASRKWPRASLTALDLSPAMLREAQRKIPGLKTITGDAAQALPGQKFDIILSSMMLHWLPEPQAALTRWRKSLKPDGRLYVALLAEGSFRAWRDLCRAQGIEDGLWPLPPAGFADDLAARKKEQPIPVNYPSAREFLRRLKTIGAATPRSTHKPVPVAAMRRLLAHAPKPFAVTYQALYLEIAAAGSI